MKRLLTAALLFLLTVTLISTPTASAVVDNTPDNDSVAIIRGGVYSEAAVRDKARQGDVPRVFSAFGINQNELNGFVDGVVWKDGRVTIGHDRLVARGAVTAGRWDNPKPGMTRIPNTDRAYKMSTSNFVDEGQTAFIKMVNGRFDFAIIKPCGNPVTANPVTPPNPPTPGLTVEKDVKTMQGNDWRQTVTVRPGEHVMFRITAKNTGKVTLDKLSFQDVLPGGLTEAPNGKASIDGTPIGNEVTNGFTLKPLKPGEQHIIIFEAKTEATEKRESACEPGLVNKGIVRSGDVVPDKSDTAVVKVCAPDEAPTFACESLTHTIVDQANRRVRFTARHTVSEGATFSHYLYDFGDGSAVARSTSATVEHTYPRDGSFTARVSVVFRVNGQERTVTAEACTQPISFTTPVAPTPEQPAKGLPKQLVDTGPGALIGGVISTIVGGTIAYKYVWLRRFV